MTVPIIFYFHNNIIIYYSVIVSNHGEVEGIRVQVEGGQESKRLGRCTDVGSRIRERRAQK